jgi:hypothetical protein
MRYRFCSLWQLQFGCGVSKLGKEGAILHVLVGPCFRRGLLLAMVGAISTNTRQTLCINKKKWL